MFGLSPITTALSIALALSVAGNGLLTNAYLGARDDRIQAQSDRDSARGAAQQCSDGVSSLQAAAEKRASESDTLRKAADAARALAERRADAILGRQPKYPADDCRSAVDAQDEWLSNRTKK